MKLINKIAALSIGLATAGILTTAPNAEAACYPSLAAQEMELILAGGGSNADAINYSLSQNNIEETSVCVYQVKGYANKYKILYPYLYQMFWG